MKQACDVLLFYVFQRAVFAADGAEVTLWRWNDDGVLENRFALKLSEVATYTPDGATVKLKLGTGTLKPDGVYSVGIAAGAFLSSVGRASFAGLEHSAWNFSTLPGLVNGGYYNDMKCAYFHKCYGNGDCVAVN